MKNEPELHEVLYVSTLAPEAPVQVVSQIVSHARRANETAQITGLLVFDGMHFGQQIEGPRKEVLSLIQKILQDQRHTRVEILRHGPLASRRFKRFSLGYAAADELDTLLRLENSGPDEALAQFLALVPGLDLDS